MKVCAVAALAAIMTTTEAKLKFGKCHNKPEYVDKFSPADYAGKWYEVYRDKWMPYEISADCVTQEFTPQKDGTMNLKFRGYYWALLDYMGVVGTLFDCENGSKDTWTCQATMGHTGTKGHHSPIHILGTDYKNYAVNYECKDHMHGIYHSEWATILSRTPDIADEHHNAARQLIHKNSPYYDLSSHTMHRTRQEKCEYDW